MLRDGPCPSIIIIFNIIITRGLPASHRDFIAFQELCFDIIIFQNIIRPPNEAMLMHIFLRRIYFGDAT